MNNIVDDFFQKEKKGGKRKKSKVRPKKQPYEKTKWKKSKSQDLKK